MTGFTEMAAPLPVPAPPAAAAQAAPSPLQLADAAADKYGLPRQLVRSVMATDQYVIHEIVLPSGTTVREYVSAGRVCAVAWRGPWLPDMRILLGSYFDQYRKAFRHKRSSHQPFVVDEPGLVVHAGGHMRGFFGEAHVPALLPNGARIEELR
jgi:hypothetical protein